MLNPAGKLIGDFTIACADPERFLMWGSSQAQIYHMRWFESQLPADGSVRLRRFDLDLVGLSIAGPRSRELLAQLTDEDVSGTALKFMDHRAMDIANVPAMVNRVSYTGDLGYEIWVRPEYLRRLYAEIRGGGPPAGSQALRHACALVPAFGEELSDLVSRAATDLWAFRSGPRALRRSRQARLRRARGGAAREGERRRATARELRGRGSRCGRARR